MHGTRRGIAGMLSFAVIILALTVGAGVDTHAAYRSAVAANDTTIATPSPTATNTPASVKTSTGGSAPWGFLLAIFAAIAIFIVGGIIVAMRARGEYLAEQARKAAIPRDGDESA